MMPLISENNKQMMFSKNKLKQMMLSKNKLKQMKLINL